MDGIGGAIDGVLKQLSGSLEKTVRPLYQKGKIPEARQELGIALQESLEDFENMFGFPDSNGMGAMAKAVELAARFTIEYGDLEEAKRLLERNWAFAGGLPKFDNLKP